MTTMLMDSPAETLTKHDEAAKQDFTAEVAEWLEAFDQVVRGGPRTGRGDAGRAAAAGGRDGRGG